MCKKYSMLQSAASPRAPENRNIYFAKGVPIRIELYSVEREAPHYHDGYLEICYCLKGRAVMKNNYEEILLENGDILLLNPRDIHCLIPDEDNLFVSFYFDLGSDVFSKWKPSDPWFICEKYVLPKKTQDKIQSLKQILLTMLYLCYFPQTNVDTEKQLLRLSHAFMGMLRNDFLFCDYLLGEERLLNDQRERFERILVYVNHHYQEKLTASKLAEIENLNANYISHFIKKTHFTGLPDLVNFIRIYEADKLLLDTDMNITDIAYAVGFSDVKYFYRHFHRWYNMTPYARRKELMKDVEKSSENNYFSTKELDIEIEHYISYYFATLNIPDLWNVPYEPFRNVPL